MRAVVQRVSSASVSIDEPGGTRETGRIGPGLLVFVGVEREDGPGDVAYIVGKVRDLRVFEANGYAEVLGYGEAPSRPEAPSRREDPLHVEAQAHVEAPAAAPGPAKPASGRMTRSVVEAGGAVLVVSQFTLAGDCRKGRRPSFDGAAAPHVARPLYEGVVAGLRETGVPVATGEFQAMMRVSLVNDGPVTILLDSRRKF
jgi:D-aminoacyl-tRNA deacylase